MRHEGSQIRGNIGHAYIELLRFDRSANTAAERPIVRDTQIDDALVGDTAGNAERLRRSNKRISFGV